MNRLVLKKRKALIGQVKRQCHSAIRYEDRVRFVEGTIEGDLRWFATTNKEAYHEQILEKVRQVERRRRKLERVGTIGNATSQKDDSLNAINYIGSLQASKSRASSPVAKTEGAVSPDKSQSAQKEIRSVEVDQESKRASGASQRQNSGVSHSLKSSSQHYWL